MCYIIRNENYYREYINVDSPLDNIMFTNIYDAWNYIDKIIKYEISAIDINKIHPHIYIGSKHVALYFYEDDFINPSESHWFGIKEIHKYEKDVDN